MAEVITAAAFADAVVDRLGPERVATDLARRRAASTDWAHMSPILSQRLPCGLADVVVYPSAVEELHVAVGLAHAYRVPITPRGKGTGNYGQAIPLQDGLVIDLDGMNEIVDVGKGWIEAEAGAKFVVLEKAANATGQELAMMPSTVGSAVGGFIAGGAGGTGSIAHGWNWDGFVQTLDVLPCTDTPKAVEVTGADTLPMVHAYGTTGLIAACRVQLVPMRDWTALFASFDTFADAVAAGFAIMDAEPRPRLVSVDDTDLIGLLGDDPAMPHGRASLRCTIDVSQETDARVAVADAGGRVEAVRPKGPAYLTSISFNHTTHRARKIRPDLCHLQLVGDALTTRTEEIKAVFTDTMLHLDGFRADDGGVTYGGMLMCKFEGADRLYAGMKELEALGVHVDDPHTWELSYNLDRLRSAAAEFDPSGLLNPGKLPRVAP